MILCPCWANSSLPLIVSSGGRDPESGLEGWDHRLAQEDSRGHVVAAVARRPAGEHGQPAAGVAGAEGRDGHHDAPAQPGPVRGRWEQGQHTGGGRQQPGQPLPHGSRLASVAVSGTGGMVGAGRGSFTPYTGPLTALPPIPHTYRRKTKVWPREDSQCWNYKMMTS